MKIKEVMRVWKEGSAESLAKIRGVRSIAMCFEKLAAKRLLKKWRDETSFLADLDQRVETFVTF